MPLALLDRQESPAGPLPREALAYWRSKELKPAFRSDDVWREEHATAFTVAKLTERELLADVQRSLDEALAKGTPFAEWAQGIRPTFDKSGWSRYSRTEGGTLHRLKTVYDTNMRMARAVGQWERIQRTKLVLPFLQLNLGPSRVHRELHVKWAGTILAVDDAWWLTHAPPMGYGCKCWLRQLSRLEAQRLGISTVPPTHLVPFTNPKTGSLELVDEGLDPTFAYPRTQAQRVAVLNAMLSATHTTAKPPPSPTPEPRLVAPDGDRINPNKPEGAPQLGGHVPDAYWRDSTAPTGPLDAQALAKGLRALTERAPGPAIQREARRQLNTLCASEGLVCNDIARRAGAQDVLEVRPLGRRLAGAHSLTGRIVFNRDQVANLRQATDKMARGQKLEQVDTQALSTLVHETVHGHSPMQVQVYMQPVGRVVEEATTEIAAAELTAKLTGVPYAKVVESYPAEQRVVAEGLKLIEGLTKTASARHPVDEQLRVASLEMRKTVDLIDSADQYIGHFAGALPGGYGKMVRKAMDEAEARLERERATHPEKFAGWDAERTRREVLAERRDAATAAAEGLVSVLRRLVKELGL